MRRVGTKQNDNFYFHDFSAFSNLFWLEMKAKMVFLNFLNFFAIFFLIFYYTSGRNGTKGQFLFSLFLGLFQPILAWKEAITVFFNFLNFFAIFFELSLLRLVGTKQNDNFYFLCFLALSNLFLLEMKP